MNQSFSSYPEEVQQEAISRLNRKLSGKRLPQASSTVKNAYGQLIREGNYSKAISDANTFYFDLVPKLEVEVRTQEAQQLAPVNRVDRARAPSKFIAGNNFKLPTNKQVYNFFDKAVNFYEKNVINNPSLSFQPKVVTARNQLQNQYNNQISNLNKQQSNIEKQDTSKFTTQSQVDTYNLQIEQYNQNLRKAKTTEQELKDFRFKGSSSINENPKLIRAGLEFTKDSALQAPLFPFDIARSILKEREGKPPKNIKESANQTIQVLRKEIEAFGSGIIEYVESLPKGFIDNPQQVAGEVGAIAATSGLPVLRRILRRKAKVSNEPRPITRKEIEILTKDFAIESLQSLGKKEGTEFLTGKGTGKVAVVNKRTGKIIGKFKLNTNTIIKAEDLPNRLPQDVNRQKTIRTPEGIEATITKHGKALERIKIDSFSLGLSSTTRKPLVRKGRISKSGDVFRSEGKGEFSLTEVEDLFRGNFESEIFQIGKGKRSIDIYKRPLKINRSTRKTKVSPKFSSLTDIESKIVLRKQVTRGNNQGEVVTYLNKINSDLYKDFIKVRGYKRAGNVVNKKTVNIKGFIRKSGKKQGLTNINNKGGGITEIFTPFRELEFTGGSSTGSERTINKFVNNGNGQVLIKKVKIKAPSSNKINQVSQATIQAEFNNIAKAKALQDLNKPLRSVKSSQTQIFKPISKQSVASISIFKQQPRQNTQFKQGSTQNFKQEQSQINILNTGQQQKSFNKSLSKSLVSNIFKQSELQKQQQTQKVIPILKLAQQNKISQAQFSSLRLPRTPRRTPFRKIIIPRPRNVDLIKRNRPSVNRTTNKRLVYSSDLTSAVFRNIRKEKNINKLLSKTFTGLEVRPIIKTR